MQISVETLSVSAPALQVESRVYRVVSQCIQSSATTRVCDERNTVRNISLKIIRSQEYYHKSLTFPSHKHEAKDS